MSLDPKTLWKEQDVSVSSLSPSDLEARFTAQRAALGRRNRTEYVAGAIVIVVFLAYAALLPGAVVKAGSLLTAAGAGFVIWQLKRRAGLPPLADDLPARDLVGFQVEELRRQRDALRSVPLWYLAPLLPGFVTFFTGVYLQRAGDPVTGLGLPLLGIVLLFLAVWWLNHRAARTLERQIRDLETYGDQA